MPAGAPKFDHSPTPQSETVSYRFAVNQDVRMRSDRQRIVYKVAERGVVAGRISYRLHGHGFGNTYLAEADLEAV